MGPHWRAKGDTDLRETYGADLINFNYINGFKVAIIPRKEMETTSISCIF